MLAAAWTQLAVDAVCVCKQPQTQLGLLVEQAVCVRADIHTCTCMTDCKLHHLTQCTCKWY